MLQINNLVAGGLTHVTDIEITKGKKLKIQTYLQSLAQKLNEGQF